MRIVVLQVLVVSEGCKQSFFSLEILFGILRNVKSSRNALSISKQPSEVWAVVEALQEVYSSPEEVRAS